MEFVKAKGAIAGTRAVERRLPAALLYGSAPLTLKTRLEDSENSSSPTTPSHSRVESLTLASAHLLSLRCLHSTFAYDRQARRPFPQHCSDIMAAKRKLADMAKPEEGPVDPSDELMFLCLGGGNEVGRSCHIIQYKGKTVMVSHIATSIQLLQANSLPSSMPECTQHTMVTLPCLSGTNLTSALSTCYS